ncbi:hypothetical protein LJU39_11550 [Citrobacter freundii]|uniref:Uncharacterized protein n=1 Tax=Citrobacter portucalensis TaxID=1639133 RepID=A0AAW9EGG9_9ENTR|nr:MULTISPECIES: hypothetical protein [Citrobacter]MBY5091359.1 hypothetical protein [Citrobacter freundii]MDE9633568.1 hypothetical protein [Citrobacter freundii]MDH1796235.1 hypothetical protein [Citrobacter portucalensis]MDM2919159.1 hypothetical protein [Citrobacter sp. Cpo032]MDN4370992.1 hypothetical protein [Citrobacter portucalensis]
MTALNKQAGAGDVNPKTYYIHPAAFGSTKDHGYGHVPVVKADDFENLRAKLEAAEKRIAELVARIYIPQPLNIEDEYQNYEYVAGWNDCRNATACRSEHIDRDTGIGVKGE